MSEKKLSVIVPVYNAQKYLHQCVDSIINQTYRNLEIFLVNDGSKDGSGQICDELAVKDSRIRVIHKENGGAASARNRALELAAGEYITFVDSDDFIEPWAYEVMVAALEEASVKLVCGGRYNLTEGKAEESLCPQRQEVISGEEMAKRIFLWDHVDSSPCDKIFHRSLFDTIRFPEGYICEDVAILYKLAMAAERVLLLDKRVYYYRQVAGSMSNGGLCDRSFHAPRITEIIYREVRQSHPQLLDEARYLRVRSLYYILLDLEVGTDQDRQTYAEVHARFKGEMAGQLWFVWKHDRFSLQEKVTTTLIVVNCYRLLRRLIHRSKG